MRQKIFQKKNFPFLLLIPMFLFLGILYLANGKDTRAFHSLTDSLLHEELDENTLNLHYTFADPKEFGFEDYTVSLPVYSKAETDSTYEKQRIYLDNLHKIHPANLSDTDENTYYLLENQLSHSLCGLPFLYYDEPLSPSSGMQSQLPVLLAEYTFRSVGDVEDYLKLLDQTDEYFASLLVFETEKKAAGLLQSDLSLSKVRTQCDTILCKEDLDAGTHFLQTTFEERLQILKDQNLITDKELQKYREENNRLLRYVMLPAYEQLSDGLFLLMNDDSSLPEGLCHKPQGREYYEWLTKSLTGSERSMEEIKAMLYTRFDKSYRLLSQALNNNPTSSMMWMQAITEDTFPLHSPEEMLLDLQTRIQKDFPDLPEGNAGFTVKEVADSLSPYCAPAFYLTPPLDDTDTNVIYINKSEEKSGLELYTTLAHEGYPGHLYQSVYSNRLFLKENADPARALLSYPGFQEGYALYVEFLSYDYAADLAGENGNPDLAYGYEVEKYNRDMQLCLLAFLDVSIHYDGATPEEIYKVLCSIGITDYATAENVYTYIAEEPANYLKYYIGYLEIENLKEEAAKLWGENYSDLNFHRFLMENGPADFAYLREKLHNG